MEKLKIWLIKNWSTTLLVIIFVILFISPDAKAWLMKQIISTGILNSKIEDKNDEKSVNENNLIISEKFIVREENGKLINASDLKGKVVFINFWASWCPPCRAEFPSIQSFYEKYRENDHFIFLTVNLDEDQAKGKLYLEKENFTIPFLIPAGNIPREYFSGSLPTTVILDKDGKIRLHHSGMADYSKDSFYKEIDLLLEE